MQKNIDYLKKTILPLTGMKSDKINTLCNSLGADAIIYGSAILYSVKNTTKLGKNNIPVGDIDILTNSIDKFDQYIDLLYGAIPNVTIMDRNQYILDSGSHDEIIKDYRNNGIKIPDDTLYNTDFLDYSKTRKYPQYLLNSSFPPTGTAKMGTLDITIKMNPYPNNMDSFYYGTQIIFYNKTTPSVQLIYKNDVTENLANYIYNNGDFTVASGSFDGGNILISNDYLSNITTYRDPVGFDANQHQSGIIQELEGYRNTEWMLYRLKKYIDRGFTIYFDNKVQIDKWNSIPTNALSMAPEPIKPTPVEPIPIPVKKRQSYWWLSSKTKPLNCCPFILAPSTKPAPNIQANINYLKNNILPITGLSTSNINLLCDYYLSKNTIIYGSSILYAASNTTIMGPKNVPIGDIDILTNNQVVFNELIDFFFNSIPSVSIMDRGLPFPKKENEKDIPIGKDSSNYLNCYINKINFPEIIVSGKIINNAIPQNGEDIVNHDTKYFLDSSTIPTSKQLMGNLNLTLNDHIPAVPSLHNGVNTYMVYYGTQIFFFSYNKPVIQLIYKSDITTSLSDYIYNTSDFTVASGSFDGTNMLVHPDFTKKYTIYRDPIPVNIKTKLSIDIYRSTGWMLYRLKKYIDRGFTIFFNSKTQIDAWNKRSKINKSNSKYKNILSKEDQVWWLSSSTKPTLNCPFILKPSNLAIEEPIKKQDKLIETTKKPVKLEEPIKKEAKLVEPVKKQTKLVEPVKKQTKLVEPVKKQTKLVEPVKKQVKLEELTKKCSSSTCNFLCHSDIKNNNGTHCCRSCKKNGNHGHACEKKLINKK